LSHEPQYFSTKWNANTIALRLDVVYANE